MKARPVTSVLVACPVAAAASASAAQPVGVSGTTSRAAPVWFANTPSADGVASGINARQRDHTANARTNDPVIRKNLARFGGTNLVTAATRRTEHEVAINKISTMHTSATRT